VDEDNDIIRRYLSTFSLEPFDYPKGSCGIRKIDSVYIPEEKIRHREDLLFGFRYYRIQ
jgi:hypothetical protein